ncbi:hypothetical protein CSC81_16850, partial [Tenacibaculum discolor]
AQCGFAQAVEVVVACAALVIDQPGFAGLPVHLSHLAAHQSHQVKLARFGVAREEKAQAQALGRLISKGTQLDAHLPLQVDAGQGACGRLQGFSGGGWCIGWCAGATGSHLGHDGVALGHA